MSPSGPRITEVAFAKNEGRFLLEWIAYHRSIGVTDFLVYTNDCEDESPALLERLQEMGIVQHVPNLIAPGELPQNKALNRAAEHSLVTEADYVLQIDPDEFLCVKTGDGTIADLIATAPNADIITVQMRFFGDSGLEQLGDGLVIEQLTAASHEAFERNNIVKSLARCGGPFFKITANHMPGFEPDNGQHPRIFNCGGVEIAPHANGGKRFRTMPDGFRTMANAQLNHYAVKTFSDYRAKKYRGTAANNDSKLTMGYWRARNRNDVQDLSILRRVPAAKRLMATWLGDTTLAALNQRCFEAYAEIVAKAQNIFTNS